MSASASAPETTPLQVYGRSRALGATDLASETLQVYAGIDASPLCVSMCVIDPEQVMWHTVVHPKEWPKRAPALPWVVNGQQWYFAIVEMKDMGTPGQTGRAIASSLHELLQQNYQPHEVTMGIEDYIPRNMAHCRSSHQLHEFQGALKLGLSDYDLTQVNARRLKHQFAGHGSASKHDMKQRAFERMARWYPEDATLFSTSLQALGLGRHPVPDMTDAMAVAWFQLPDTHSKKKS